MALKKIFLVTLLMITSLLCHFGYPMKPPARNILLDEPTIEGPMVFGAEGTKKDIITLLKKLEAVIDQNLGDIEEYEYVNLNIFLQPKTTDRKTFCSMIQAADFAKYPDAKPSNKYKKLFGQAKKKISLDDSCLIMLRNEKNLSTSKNAVTRLTLYNSCQESPKKLVYKLEIDENALNKLPNKQISFILGTQLASIKRLHEYKKEDPQACNATDEERIQDCLTAATKLNCAQDACALLTKEFKVYPESKSELNKKILHRLNDLATTQRDKT